MPMIETKYSVIGLGLSIRGLGEKLFKGKEEIIIDMDEMVTYIEKVTGIHPIIIYTVLDAEEMFLRSKGVIV